MTDWRTLPDAVPENAPIPQDTGADWRGLPDAAPPPPPPSKPSVSAIPTNDQIANWMTFGLANKAAALGSAVGGSLPGAAYPNQSGFWQKYSDKLNAMRDQGQAFTEAHPVENAAGSIVGGMLGAPVAAGAKLATGLGGAIGQGIAAGGTIGGLAGAGGAETGKELSGTTEGALTGATIGGAIPPLVNASKPVLEGFQQMLPSLFPQASWNAALNRIAQRVQQSTAAGGPDVAQMQAGLVPGKPMGLVDVGGAPVQGLAGAVARSPGEPSEVAKSFFTSRDANAGSRLIGDIDANISAGSSAPDALTQLFQQRKAAAAPLYQKAYVAPALNPDTIAAGGELDQMMSRPSMNKAGLNALNLAAEEGRNPASLGIGFDPSGAVKFQNVPSWQTLDYLKRGLDDVVEQYRDPTSGKLVLDTGGRAVNNTRQAFLDFLDRNNPDLAAARDAWSGPSQAMDLIRRGQSFQSMRPEEITTQIQGMSPQDREMYLLGVADKLRTNVQQTAINGDEAKRLVNSNYTQQQLRPLFQNQSDYDGFLRSVMAERSMFDIKTPIIGGSQTAGRIAEDAAGHGEGGIPMKLAAGALAAKGGEPFLGASMLLRGAKDIYTRMSQPSEAVRTNMANILFNPDRAQNLANLNAIGNRPAQSYLPPWLLQPGANTFGSLGPPLISGQGGSPSP